MSPSSSAASGRSVEESPTLHLARWTVTSGSNVNSRGAVVIASAIDRALADVLTGHPRLLAYDVHAVAEGPDAEGRVTVSIAPPPGAEGARGTGRYTGESTSTNIIAASIEAYIAAVNLLLAEEHWAGATDDAGNRKRARVAANEAKASRAELDEEAGRIDTTEWFNQ